MKLAVVGTRYVGLVTGTCFAKTDSDDMCGYRQIESGQRDLPSKNRTILCKINVQLNFLSEIY